MAAAVTAAVVVMAVTGAIEAPICSGFADRRLGRSDIIQLCLNDDPRAYAGEEMTLRDTRREGQAQCARKRE
jgi:hypothetical protein